MTADDRQRQLQQLGELEASGALTAAQARQARARLANHDDSATAPRPTPRLWAGVAAFSVALCAVGYFVVGNPGAWGVAPGQTAAATPAPTKAQVEQMLAQMVERVGKEPGDAKAWAVLGRSYLMLGRHAEAAGALGKLVALAPDDAQAHADLADAKAMAAGRVLAGEPAALIARALELDPDNLKALALAGTIAFERGAFDEAIRHWERAIGVSTQAGAAESELAANLRSGIAQARQRGGTPASPAAAPAVAAAATAQVAGRVTLAAALAAQASPEDTLFVFARAAQGPRMPLALLRRQVKDLPLDFTLDDSLAMSPAAKLSGASQVVIGARISKSGNATPQAGDLQGLSAPVAVGAKGVLVEISEAVKAGP